MNPNTIQYQKYLNFQKEMLKNKIKNYRKYNARQSLLHPLPDSVLLAMTANDLYKKHGLPTMY